MRRTNPDTPVAKDSATDSGSVTTLKSFKDLKEQVTLKQIHAFADLIRKGIDNWRTAGQTLVELARTETDIFKKIQAIYPNLSTSTLETFMRIGRKEIWPPLLADSSYGARRLLECNYDLQKEYADKPIKVATYWKGDKIQTVEKHIQDLTRAEVAIVFDGRGGINNIEQQAFRLPSAYRSAKPFTAIAEPTKAIEYKQPTKRNVDIGYFSITVGKDGTVVCEPCARPATAQPVRVEKTSNGFSAKIVVYHQEVN